MRGASQLRLLGLLCAGLVIVAVWVIFGESGNEPMPDPLAPEALEEVVGPSSDHVNRRGRFLRIAFQEGAWSTTYEGEDVRIAVREIGTLRVRSGRVVACDPILLFPEPRPFARVLENGDYPVDACVVTRPNGSEQVAMARVRIRAHPAVAFQLAPFEAETLQDLIDSGEVTGHAVSSGASGFVDAHAAMTLWRRKQGGVDQAAALADRLGSTAWATAEVHGEAGNLALFSVGNGDGFCLSFWGYDAWGEVASLVTDCNVLGLPESGD